MTGLSHIDASGKAVMVDVSGKPITDRAAIACGSVTMQPETLALICQGGIAKGDVLAVARLAGIMAAKRTAELIPLCHPLGLDAVELELAPAPAPTPTSTPARAAVLITATCRVTGRTGVEMEALTAVAIAGLTVYDMCKAVDRGMVLGEIRLLRKSGGASGLWEAGASGSFGASASGVGEAPA
jgi:cyclic pyranopterin monophosphate synthase